MSDLQQHIQNLAGAINLKCGEHLVRGLRGGHIFAQGTVMLPDGQHPYAFNDTGREELQFNIGFEYGPDGEERFRHGVALSFQPSPSYPDVVETLRPKATRFDEYFGVQSNREMAAAQRLKMWYWKYGDATPSADHDPQYEVCSASELAQEGNFLVLGKHVLVREFEQLGIDRWTQIVLNDFDFLYSNLYHFVEGGAG